MQKIEVYKKTAAVASLQAADDLFDELMDRFGEPPEEVVNLIFVAKLKVYGMEYGIESISHKGDDIHIRFAANRVGTVNGQKLLAIGGRMNGRLKLHEGANMLITLKGKGLSAQQQTEMLEQFMMEYQEVSMTKGVLQHVAK